jgi:hypothetical protein
MDDINLAKQKIIELILEEFEVMGAKENDLAVEKVKLETNQQYFFECVEQYLTQYGLNDGNADASCCQCNGCSDHQCVTQPKDYPDVEEELDQCECNQCAPGCCDEDQVFDFDDAIKDDEDKDE